MCSTSIQFSRELKLHKKEFPIKRKQISKLKTKQILIFCVERINKISL